jgi:hypothetical protein
MESSGVPIPDNRPLSAADLALARWMLTHGTPAAAPFLAQLERARVVSRCPCGCASIGFEVADLPAPSGGLHILGDFLYGDDATLAGAFIFERGGVLAGIEVWSPIGEDAPRILPSPAELRPSENAAGAG